MTSSVLALRGVKRTYHLGRSIDVPALRGVDLEVDAGEFVAIVGPSGSGKTTLLNMAGLLDHPDTGEVLLRGDATSRLPEPHRARLRRLHIGFIFQAFNLLPHLTAEENVAMPLRYTDARSPRRDPMKLLESVGLGARRRHKPTELSGGEQQRVAVARALVLDPPLLLADEPTGELDSETAADIHQLLRSLCEVGKALVVVTHNVELAALADRTVHMRDGLIEDEPHPEKATPGKKKTATKKRAQAKKATPGRRGRSTGTTRAKRTDPE